MCTKGFLNYLSAIVVFLKVVFKDEIVNFSKHCGTFAIKESGGVKVKLWKKKVKRGTNEQRECVR